MLQLCYSAAPQVENRCIMFDRSSLSPPCTLQLIQFQPLSSLAAPQMEDGCLMFQFVDVAAVLSFVSTTMLPDPVWAAFSLDGKKGEKFVISSSLCSVFPSQPGPVWAAFSLDRKKTGV